MVRTVTADDRYRRVTSELTSNLESVLVRLDDSLRVEAIRVVFAPHTRYDVAVDRYTAAYGPAPGGNISDFGISAEWVDRNTRLALYQTVPYDSAAPAGLTLDTHQWACN